MWRMVAVGREPLLLLVPCPSPRLCFASDECLSAVRAEQPLPLHCGPGTAGRLPLAHSSQVLPGLAAANFNSELS